jgi:hypothetical protein
MWVTIAVSSAGSGMRPARTGLKPKSLNAGLGNGVMGSRGGVTLATTKVSVGRPQRSAVVCRPGGGTAVLLGLASGSGR